MTKTTEKKTVTEKRWAVVSAGEKPDSLFLLDKGVTKKQGLEWFGGRPVIRVTITYEAP